MRSIRGGNGILLCARFNNFKDSRFFSRKTKRTLFLRNLYVVFLIWLIGGWPTIVFALPQDGQIVSGTGSISTPTATSMQVDQNTSQMIVNWDSFNIGSSESVNFTQPSSSAIALNRVIGADPSLLLGNLTANGQVFIVNGSGVFFGPGSKVDTHGLIATTMAISDQDFLDQNYNFSQQASLASVINEGNISATSYVGLLAPAVENRGTIITASLGSIDLAAGKAATLDFTGDGLINFKVTEAVVGIVTDKDGNVLQDRVSNSGFLQANGGQVRMTAKDAGDVIRSVINMEGIIEANTVAEEDGWVILGGGNSGVVSVTGTITASGDDAGEKGGTVHVLGEKVGLFDNAVVNVSGDAGGGTALIGGDYQGKNAEVQNAFRTYVGEDAVIDASAGTSGNGGKVIVWADDVTRFYGSVLATGGSLSGDGGFVEVSGKGSEVSGKGSLDFHAHQIALGAVNGVDGTLLLDPLNITLDTSTNDFGTLAITNGLDVTLVDTNALVLGVTTNVTGNLVVSAGGDLTQSALISVGGTSSFSVTGSSVATLTNTSNDFTGAVTFSSGTGAVQLTDSTATILAASTLGGKLTVISSGAIMQTGVLSLGGEGTIQTTGDITLSNNVIVVGRLTITADSDGNGVGDLTLDSGVTISTSNNELKLQGANIDISSATANAGSGAATFSFTQDTTLDGSGVTKLTAGSLEIDVSGNLIIDGVTASELLGVSGLVTLKASGDITAKNNASSSSGAVTFLANNDINIQVDVTTSGDFIAKADNDNNGVGKFVIDSGVTATSTSGNIDITAVQIQENGTLTASGDVIKNGVITQLNESDQSDLDTATNSTFVQGFTSAADSGC